MAWLSPLLTVVALVMLPVAGLVTMRVRTALFPATWSAQQRAADIAQQVEETVTGVRVVKGFGQEAREVATLERAAGRLYAERMRAAWLTARLNPTLLALPTLGQVAVIGFGGYLALTGAISLGTFLAFTTYIAMLVGPARLIGSLVVSAQLTRAAAERIYDLIDSQPDVVDPADPAALPAGALGVELDAVTFGYSRREPVLDRRLVAGGARGDPGAGRPAGLGQVDGGAAAAPLLRPATRRAAPGWGAAAHAADGRAAPRARGGVRGGVPVLRHHPRQHRLRPTRRERRRHRGCGPGRSGAHLRRRAARGLPHRGRGARVDAVRWPAAADRAGQGRADRPAGAGARRRDVGGRQQHRGGHPGHVARAHRRPDHAAGRAPPLHAGAGRPDRRAGRRSAGRHRHRGRADAALCTVPRTVRDGRRRSPRRPGGTRRHDPRTVAGTGRIGLGGAGSDGCAAIGDDRCRRGWLGPAPRRPTRRRRPPS